MNDVGFEPLADVIARLVEKLARPSVTPVAHRPRHHPSDAGGRTAEDYGSLTRQTVRVVSRHIRQGGTELAAGRLETGRRPLSAGACTADVIVAVSGEFKKIRAFAPRSLEGIADSPAAYVRGGLDSRTPVGEGPTPLASVATLEGMP